MAVTGSLPAEIDRLVLIGFQDSHNTMTVLGLVAYIGSAIIGGVVGTALVTRYDRRQPAFTFGLFVLAMGVWSATYVGYLAASTPRWLLGFIQLSYLSVVSAPVIWFVFAVQYTDRSHWLSRRRIALLSVVPLVILGLVFTAQYHSLYYASITPTTVEGLDVIRTEAAIGHSINLVYAYGILIVGNGLIVGELFTDNRLYKRQSMVLIACLAAPWAANGVFHLGFKPVPTADLTPVVFVLSSLPLAVIVHRAELTGFVPVAHERVFNTLDDPVFVITPTNRVLDANHAARDLIDADEVDKVNDTDEADAAPSPVEGSDITDLLPETLLDDGQLHPDLATAMECVIEVDGTPHQYIARLRESDPDWQADPRGRLLSLTDITLQKNQQESLEAKNEQLERLASVVAHDLATPLATGESLLHLVRADLTNPAAEVDQSLADLETVHDRLRAFAEGLPALARESTDVEAPTDCDLETVARAAWDVVDTGDLRLVIESTCRLRGDPSRLQQIFENLFQNSVEHGSTSSRPQADDCADHATDDDQPSASTVTVGTLSDDPGYYIEDDGPGIPADRRADLLAFGVSTGEGSGYGLAIVRTIVEAHGWSLSVTDGETGGARFEVETTTHGH